MYFRIIGFKDNQIVATRVVETPKGQESLVSQHAESFKQEYEGKIDVVEVAAILSDVKV